MTSVKLLSYGHCSKSLNETLASRGDCVWKSDPTRFWHFSSMWQVSFRLIHPINHCGAIFVWSSMRLLTMPMILLVFTFTQVRQQNLRYYSMCMGADFGARCTCMHVVCVWGGVGGQSILGPSLRHYGDLNHIKWVAYPSLSSGVDKPMILNNVHVLYTYSGGYISCKAICFS